MSELGAIATGSFALKSHNMKNIKTFLAVAFVVSAQITIASALTTAEIARFAPETTTISILFDKCVSGNCVNGRGKMVYDNGDTYEGDFVDGRRVGQGTYTFKNGQVYVGQFTDGLRNGKGKFTFSDGSTYEGSFVLGNFIGHGTYTTKSAGKQTGEYTVGQIVDLQTKVLDTDFWGKAEIIEIAGDKYRVRDLNSKTIDTVSEQKIRPFTAPVKYEVGQKVEVLDRGIWYKGEIIGSEVKYNDHYRIRFEGTTNLSDRSENVRYIRPGIGSSTAQTKREIPVSANNTSSQGTQPKSNSGIDGIVAVYRSEASKQGAKLLGSGIYNAVEHVEFNLMQGETYVLVAVIEGQSPFGIDLYSYSERDFLKPTHSWDDKEYKVESFKDYAMKSRIVKTNGYSTLQLNLGLTTKSGIRRIRLSPNKDKGKPLHWIFYKLK
jgi:hypothetical protein